MKKTILSAFALSTCAAFPAFAGGSLTLGYIPQTEIEVSDSSGSGSVDGDGFSIQGAFDVGEQLFIYAEYYDRTFEESGVELGLNSTRVGLGFVASATEAAVVWLGANVERATLEFGGDDDSESGFGLRAGVNLPLGPSVYAVAEVGYVSIEDADGFDLAAGLGIPISESASITLDYRLLALTVDEDFGSDTDIDVSDLRLGVRFDF